MTVAGRGWTIGALLVAALVAVPIIAVLVIAAGPDGGIWAHLSATVLPRYVGTTLALMAGVGVGTLAIGVGTAWLVAMCRFPGRAVFQWALLLPLAMPSYVIAFIYTDALEYAGPVQGALRAAFGWTSPHDYWFPEIRSLGGAIAMMSLVLYPYVYLLSRAAFVEQTAGVLEVSRTLGRGPWRTFVTVAVPLARPSIVVGVSLALMETLNDFGTVDFFAVQTLTLGIFDVWFNLNSVAGAAQIAVTMLVFVLLLLTAERLSRRRRRHYDSGGRRRPAVRRELTGHGGVLAFLACLVPLAAGFLIPVAWLVGEAAKQTDLVASGSFLASLANSLILSIGAALIAVAVGLYLAYAIRQGGSRLLRAATRFASLGYAIPGAVLAVGVIVPMAWLDNQVDAAARSFLGVSTGLVMSGTVFALIFAFVVRFLALSEGTVEASLDRITPSIDGAARTLGAGPGAVLRRIHLPLIRGSLLTAAILVFVDGMKELPMTMILRPFGFETLATQVHQYTSLIQFSEASPAALAIVMTGVLPVILLSRAAADGTETAPAVAGMEAATP